MLGPARGGMVITSAFGFESFLELESSDFSMWHFLKLFIRGFLRDTPVSSPPSLVNGSANKIKLK